MSTKQNKDFAIFILTHGRPDKVVTVDALKKYGYTGKWYIVIDNEDDTASEYYERYGNKVIMFDKKRIAETFDTADNFDNRKSIVYARNASFYIARHLGITYFMQMDDDYCDFTYTEDTNGDYTRKQTRNLDLWIEVMLEWYKSIPAHSIAMAQGGDFIGGVDSSMWKAKIRRKAMNSFLCSVERPFKFMGRINEDVNIYTRKTNMGYLFMTSSLMRLEQKQTQTNSGGMTEIYKANGTYLKTFYSIMYQPSSVTVRHMGGNRLRLHHHVDWRITAPMIMRDCWRKSKEPYTNPHIRFDELSDENFIVEGCQFDVWWEQEGADFAEKDPKRACAIAWSNGEYKQAQKGE